MIKIARLQDFGNGARRAVWVFDKLDGIVAVGIKGFANRLQAPNPMLFKGIQKRPLGVL